MGSGAAAQAQAGRDPYRDAARRTIRELPDLDRQVLVRSYLHEQTADEICRELNLSISEIRRIKVRAKARFRAALKHGDLNSSNSPDRRAADADSVLHTAESVMAHVHDTFGSQQKADHWLRRPNHVFHGRTPLDVIESDPESVEIELTRIDHGVYI
jgi:uncharacterized protein (DUF2384 family)